MRLYGRFALSLSALLLGCARQAPHVQPAALTNADDAFAGSVRPVLARSCAPCHEPGGKMYERLPFDQPQTIRDHRDGIRRRLKAEDKEAVERWLASEPKESR